MRKRTREPPNPFEESERAIVARVAAGELTSERAIECAAYVRFMACSRRMRGLDRRARALQEEAHKVLSDLNRTLRVLDAMVDATGLYARHYERARDARRRAEMKTGEGVGDDYAEGIRRWRESKGASSSCAGGSTGGSKRNGA